MKKIQSLLFCNLDKLYFIALGLLVTPTMVMGAPANDGSLFGFFNLGTEGLISTNLTLAATLVLTYFLVGVLKYVKSGGDSEAKKQGVTTIIHGLIGLFVLVSVWAIISIFANTFIKNPTLTPRI